MPVTLKRCKGHFHNSMCAWRSSVKQWGLLVWGVLMAWHRALQDQHEGVPRGCKGVLPGDQRVPAQGLEVVRMIQWQYWFVLQGIH